MSEIGRVNWVICPNCKFRYYVGPQLLMQDEVPTVCPKCHREFATKPHLEPKLTGITVRERWI